MTYKQITFVGLLVNIILSLLYLMNFATNSSLTPLVIVSLVISFILSIIMMIDHQFSHGGFILNGKFKRIIYKDKRIFLSLCEDNIKSGTSNLYYEKIFKFEKLPGNIYINDDINKLKEKITKILDDRFKENTVISSLNNWSGCLDDIDERENKFDKLTK